MKSIVEILRRMSQLLREGNLYDWADSFDVFVHEIQTDPNTVRGKIKSLYGGMGSLNDIVIYKNGGVSVAETNEFDKLRIQLFDWCR